MGGDYQGVAQVLEWLARQFELSGAVRGERAGKQLEDNGVQVFHIRDGRVSEIWSHPADFMPWMSSGPDGHPARCATSPADTTSRLRR